MKLSLLKRGKAGDGPTPNPPHNGRENGPTPALPSREGVQLYAPHDAIIPV